MNETTLVKMFTH